MTNRPHRQRVLKGAKIRFGKGASIDCMVRNMSDDGACLVVESPIGIPDNFELVLVNERTAKRCQLIWRKEKQIGVQFK